MIYLEYDRAKRNYRKAKQLYESIMNEQEALFQITQPKAIVTDKDKVKMSPRASKFDDYLVKKEEKEIESRLAEAYDLMQARFQMMTQIKRDLFQSDEIKDIIFRERFLRRTKVRQIGQKLGYSEPQIYRLLKKIKDDLKDDRK